jgi:hypothetical protein
VTIALSLKVQEGVVLASDSASTLTAQAPDGSSSVVNVYDNANKIVNLHKGLPLGVITWGAGAIGSVSITSVFKNFRAIMTGHAKPPAGGATWKLNPKNYTVEAVADRLRQYIEPLYNAAYAGWSGPPDLGMIVAGFGSDNEHAEEWQINVTGGVMDGPNLLRSDALCGLTVGGQPETISRLVFGVDPRLADVMVNQLGIDVSQVGQAVGLIQEHLQLPLVQDAMPFQDALDLSEFLVDATIKMTRFMPGAPTVGGPIEVAGITKHEGFTWVKRKHYFSTQMNPKEN